MLLLWCQSRTASNPPRRVMARGVHWLQSLPLYMVWKNWPARAAGVKFPVFFWGEDGNILMGQDLFQTKFAGYLLSRAPWFRSVIQPTTSRGKPFHRNIRMWYEKRYCGWKKSCTTIGWLKHVETLWIMGCLPPSSTGAGFRNHPQYRVWWKWKPKCVRMGKWISWHGLN